MLLKRSALLVAAAALMAVVPISAASAQAVSHTDSTGDVVSADPTAATDTTTPTPTVTQDDIRRAGVSHNTRSVVLTTTFRDLKTSGGETVHVYELRTNTGLHREVAIDAAAGYWRGHVSFTNLRGDKMNCAGLAHYVDYAKNVVTVTVPRSCLGSPRWVQTANGVVRFDPTGLVYADDARSRTVGNNLVWSPKIRRG